MNHKSYEYHKFVDVVDPDDNFDELKVLNERAALGWRLHNMQHAQQTTNVQAISGQPIVRLVVVMVMYREIEAKEQEEASGETQS